MLRIPPKCQILHRFYLPILIASIIATAIGIYYTTHLSLESDLAELLPESFPSVKALNRMKKEVGSVGELRLVIETDNFPAATRAAADLSSRLLASPLIKNVDYGNDVDFYEHNALLFLSPATLDSLHDAIQRSIDKAKQRLNPLMVDDLFGGDDEPKETDELETWETKYSAQQPSEYYTNADSTVLVLRVYPAQSNVDLSFIRSLLSEVHEIVDSVRLSDYDPSMHVYYGGNFKNRLDEFEVVRSDIFGTALYGFAGVFLLIVLYFRRLVGALLITISLLFALSWTFGLTYLVIGQLNTITGFLFVILFGLGIDYGIHAFARYVESRKAGLSLEQSIEKTVCGTGSALATTAITTSAAFFSLMLMDFRGFSDLGFIAGMGMLFSFLAMVMVLPTMLIVADRIGILRIRPQPGVPVDVDRSSTPLQHARTIVLVAVPVTLLAAWWFSHVGFEYDFTNLRAITPERAIVDQKTRGVFKLSDSPAVILTNSREEVEEVVAAVEKKMAEDTISPTIAAVRSIFSLVPEDQDERLARIREIRTLVNGQATDVLTGHDKERLDRLRTYLRVDAPFTWDDFPEKDKRRFIARDGTIGNFVFVYPSVALRDGRNAIAFRNDVETIHTPSGKVFHAASSNIIAADMLLIMVREGRIAVLLTVVVVFLIVWIDFRSAVAAALVLSPLIVGVIWMGGIMYLMGMKLNIFNIVVIPTVIGIGVDNGVHIYHRYLEEGPGSLRFVLRHTGLAITMTTLTTLVGYSGLILARHPGLNSIGDLAVIGITAAFVAAVLLMPAIIQMLEKAKRLPHIT